MSLPWDDASAEDILADLRAFKAQHYAEPWKPIHVIFQGALIEGFVMSETYVAIYPYSNTNNTNKFRVTKFSDWSAVLDGNATTYPFTTYDTFEQAVTARDRMNAKAEESSEVPD